MQLLSVVELAGRRIRNRIVFGPHETNLARGRSISDRHLAYYRRRAAGGSGLIVTEEASVHPLDWPYERAPLADDCAEGWDAVARACAAEGATTVAALGHAGMQGSSAYSQRELWAPSRVAHAVSRELPKEMEPEDVQSVIDGFAAAAALVATTGLAGVELNAGQHSLLRQFSSGLTNQRSDEWGPGEDGSGRLRFASTVLAAVRRALGPDRILGLRLCVDELAPWAGITPDAGAAIAALLAPAVDYLVVVRGSIYSAEATTPDTNAPAGFNLEVCGQVRAKVGGATAVVAQGSIVDAGQAEWALTEGRADLVELTRAQIADPDLARHLGNGDADRIRPCLRCNQRCRVRDARNPIVSCVVNPTTGYEATEPEGPTGTTTAPRRVMVVGAGPAGLECARVAAAAGHAVAVWDTREEPGGLVPVWTTAAGREPLALVVTWLVAECDRLGVVLRLGETISAERCRSWVDAGYEVVLCSGSHARPVEYRVDEGAQASVVDAVGFLEHRRRGEAIAAGGVLVWDPIGGPIAVSLAETLAGDGHPVTIVTPDPIVATLLSLTGDLAPANTRLAQRGVAVIRRHRLEAVEPGAAVVRDLFSGGTARIEVGLVVDAGHRLPADELWLATGGRLPRAGDAVAPRTIYEAILEGRRTALALGAGRGFGPVLAGAAAAQER